MPAASAQHLLMQLNVLAHARRGAQYNFVLGVGSPGGLWVSTGSGALEKVYSGSLNGQGGTDWHIGACLWPLPSEVR